MMSDKKPNRGVAQRYLLAMKAVELIAADRQAEQSFAPHVPDHYWIRKDG